MKLETSAIETVEKVAASLARMPLKIEYPTEYTVGGGTINRGVIRRLNPMIFLTVCCALFLVIIVASLIVFTFQPIFTPTKGAQGTYQVQSSVLTLVYNLPDKLSIVPMDWTYATKELDADKINLLQNLLQDQLNRKKLTKKTSISVIDASIARQKLASTNLLVVSPISVDSNNNTVIILNQPDSDINVNSTTQLITRLLLRYALECARKCQHNMKETIFAKTFHSLEIPIESFETLFIEEIRVPIKTFLSSSLSPMADSTTETSCIVQTAPVALPSSEMTAITYEAESARNTFISTATQFCSVCSGGYSVGRIGFANELIFEKIVSAYGGSTVVVFYYTTDRLRFANIIVNSSLSSVNVTFPMVFADIASIPVILHLCQGLNSIRIYNPNDYAPDFDRIVVY